MSDVCDGLIEFKMCELIREFRYQQGISQQELYQGLCGKKEYFQVESGNGEIDELLFEQLLSRLHVQHRLFDIMLDDDQFDRMECRHKIKLCLQKEQWERAEQLLTEYEAMAPNNNLHQQYVRAKRAELLFQTGQSAGQMFKEALELTLPVKELENRLQGSGVISEEELWLYFRYRSCEQEFAEEEYQLLLQVIEKGFLMHQIYPEVYFEVTYQYALKLWRTEEYVRCKDISKKTVSYLQDGVKQFRLAELMFLNALAELKLRHDKEKERELFQQCKQAYYISLSFCKPEMAQKMLTYCEEEFGWHIIGQVK